MKLVPNGEPDSEHKRYTHYYGDPRLAAWRELSARDKAANVVKLWSEVSLGKAPFRVADIGCGDGAVIFELARRSFGNRFVGFEISASGVQHAKKRTYTRSVEFALFDGYHIPAKNCAFDLAVMSHVLEHAECPRLLLREAARVARCVFVEVPLELNARTPSNFRRSDVGHINLFNPLLLRHLAQSCGLHVLSERVTCPNRVVFTFKRPGLIGTAHWALKAGLLRLWPALAWRVWTYYGCLIARIDT